MLADYQIEKLISGISLIDYLNNLQTAGSLEKVTQNEDGTITVESREVKVKIRESDLTIVDPQ